MRNIRKYKSTSFMNIGIKTVNKSNRILKTVQNNQVGFLSFMHGSFIKRKSSNKIQPDKHEDNHN